MLPSADAWKSGSDARGGHLPQELEATAIVAIQETVLFVPACSLPITLCHASSYGGTSCHCSGNGYRWNAIVPFYRRWLWLVEVIACIGIAMAACTEAARIASKKSRRSAVAAVHEVQALSLLNLNRDSQTESSKARREYGYAQHRATEKPSLRDAPEAHFFRRFSASSRRNAFCISAVQPETPRHEPDPGALSSGLLRTALQGSAKVSVRLPEP